MFYARRQAIPGTIGPPRSSLDAYKFSLCSVLKLKTLAFQMSKRYKSGAQKRKLKKEQEDLKTKLPKVLDFFTSQCSKDSEQNNETGEFVMDKNEEKHCSHEIVDEIITDDKITKNDVQLEKCVAATVDVENGIDLLCYENDEISNVALDHGKSSGIYS